MPCSCGGQMRGVVWFFSIKWTKNILAETGQQLHRHKIIKFIYLITCFTIVHGNLLGHFSKWAEAEQQQRKFDVCMGTLFRNTIVWISGILGMNYFFVIHSLNSHSEYNSPAKNIIWRDLLHFSQVGGGLGLVPRCREDMHLLTAGDLYDDLEPTNLTLEHIWAL